MNARSNRTGVTLRLVIGTLCALFFIPALMVIGALFSYQQQSQAQSVAARAQAEAARAQARAMAEFQGQQESVPVELNSMPAADEISLPPGRVGYRPVFETSYQNVVEVVTRPVVDPATGETRMVQETVERQVPVMTTSYVPVGFPAHGAKVMKLVEELRGMDEEDENRAAKIEEMKTLLLDEFQQQHEQQGKEIERTEKRLEKLKKTHELRAAKKDEIVQRRVEQLTGHPDILQWNLPASALSRGPESLPHPQTGSHQVPTLDATTPLFPPSPTVPFSRITIPVNPNTPQDKRDATSSAGTQPQGFIGAPLPEPQRTFSPVPSTTPPAPPLLPGPPTRTPTPPQPESEFGAAAQPAPGMLPRTFRPGLTPPGVGGDAPGKMEPSRAISITTTSTNEIFDLARRLSADILAEAAARAEQERTEKLHEKNVISDAEMQQCGERLERATRQAALAQAQWNALSDRLKRDLMYAQKSYERTRQQADGVHDSFKSGEASMKDVLEAQGAADQAQQTLEDLQAKLEQFIAAEKLTDDSSDSETDSPSVSGSDSAGQTAPETP